MPVVWYPFEEERHQGFWPGRHQLQGKWLLQERFEERFVEFFVLGLLVVDLVVVGFCLELKFVLRLARKSVPLAANKNQSSPFGCFKHPFDVSLVNSERQGSAIGRNDHAELADRFWKHGRS